MKTRFFPSLSLILVLLASACASATPAATAQTIVIVPSATPLVDFPSPTPDLAAQPVQSATNSSGSNLEATQVQAPAEAPTALPVATSRGPNLEATDPATVTLASGGLQFVEFFRFT